MSHFPRTWFSKLADYLVSRGHIRRRQSLRTDEGSAPSAKHVRYVLPDAGQLKVLQVGPFVAGVRDDHAVAFLRAHVQLASLEAPRAVVLQVPCPNVVCCRSDD